MRSGQINRIKTLTMRPTYIAIKITGAYVREHKDGRKFFDRRKVARDLADAIIANGALSIVEGWDPFSDNYSFRVFVYAAQKAPGLEGID